MLKNLIKIQARLDSFQGRMQRVKKGRTGTPILERGGWKTAFERSFQCFSHKSFFKILQKRGAGADPLALP